MPNFCKNVFIFLNFVNIGLNIVKAREFKFQCINLRMLHPDEAAFYAYWEKERLLPHYKRKPFLRGLSISLLLGILILVIAEMGWYERANMVANSRGNILWILIAIILISIGFGWIYQQFTWEMNEQRFNEIKHIKNKK